MRNAALCATSQNRRHVVIMVAIGRPVDRPMVEEFSRRTYARRKIALRFESLSWSLTWKF
jgi:hypothetical protein